MHVSEDLGQTWNAIADYVSQADWARGSFYEPGSPRRLFATVSNNKVQRASGAESSGTAFDDRGAISTAGSGSRRRTPMSTS